jgi:hypothetical protein
MDKKQPGDKPRYQVRLRGEVDQYVRSQPRSQTATDEETKSEAERLYEFVRKLTLESFKNGKKAALEDKPQASAS